MSLPSSSLSHDADQDQATHVRGHTVYDTRASIIVETAAFITDFNLTLPIFAMTIGFFNLGFSPTWRWLLLFLGELAALYISQKILFKRSVGDFIWGLRPLLHRFSFRLYQVEQTNRKIILRGIATNLLAFPVSILLMVIVNTNNPILIRADVWKLSPFLPSGNAWIITPFYYALGAWPKTFMDTPVLYSMTYEKGPPTRFVGHITAKLHADAKITLEGPKTPHDIMMQNTLPEGTTPRDFIKRCLTQTLFSQPSTLNCLKVREASLSRHISEISRMSTHDGPMDWAIRWFIVENPAIPDEEQAQGIFIGSSTETRFESRFILITAKGTHQTFILNSMKTIGEATETLMEQSIGSLRVSGELDPSRAWIDQQLQSVHLDNIYSSLNKSERKYDPILPRLAEIQALLISKISVDPKIYETYYHLGGLALLFAKESSAEHRTDFAILAKSLLHSAYSFAKDISPDDPRTEKLQTFYIESKKY